MWELFRLGAKDILDSSAYKLHADESMCVALLPCILGAWPCARFFEITRRESSVACLISSEHACVESCLSEHP